MPLERRKQVRAPSYLGGKIAFHHLYASMDCVIRNISREGCRLVFGQAGPLPSHFVLSIPAREQSLDARLVWCTGTEAGVAFDVAASAQPVSLDMARKIRRLEQDKAQLQRRVEELSGAK